MSETIMIVDDQPSQLRMAEYAIREKLHYQVVTASGTEEAVRRMGATSQPPTLVVLDLVVSEASGLQAIAKLRAAHPDLPIIVLTRYGDHHYATKALQAGATDFLPKPVELERLKLSLQHCLKIHRMSRYIEWLERKIAGHVDFIDLVGRSPQFQQSLALAKQAANSTMPVWVEGEPGTGKEMLARAIHGSSDRAGKPFVVVHCRMLPEHLAEAIIFGQEKSPQSGINGEQHYALGKLREADQGTLLLKEVTALRPELQQRLLGVLDKRTITPLGTQTAVPVNVRLICTGSQGDAKSDALRTSLHKRLQDVTITLPSLRQRKDDIVLLTEHFLCLYSASENKHIRGVTERAMQWLNLHEWPGNLRQMAHILWRAVVICERDMLDIGELQLLQRSKPAVFSNGYNNMGEALPFMDAQGHVKKLKSIEEDAIRFALGHSGGCMTRAARSLGIGRSTLYRKLNELEDSSYIARPNHTTRPIMKVSSIDRS